MKQYAGYYATFGGETYECTFARDIVSNHLVLLAAQPTAGFELAEGGRYFRTVNADECDLIVYRQEVALWRGLAVAILGEEDGRATVEFADGDLPQAREAGMDELERGVFQRTVDVDDLQQRMFEEIVLFEPATADRSAASGQ